MVEMISLAMLFDLLLVSLHRRKIVLHMCVLGEGEPGNEIFADARGAWK